jgi:hypothetical protein
LLETIDQPFDEMPFVVSVLVVGMGARRSLRDGVTARAPAAWTAAINGSESYPLSAITDYGSRNRYGNSPDGVVLKQSWVGEVRNVSVLVAIGVVADGHRQILGAAEGQKAGAGSCGT